MTKEDDEQFEDSCWVNVGSVCHNCYVDNDFKGRDHYHITGK